MIGEDLVDKIGLILSDSSRPMKARYRALFTLKNIGGIHAIRSIASNFTDDSALLKHELAYCLGQMQQAEALDVLEAVVKDGNQDVIVRHEAAEALGALGHPDLLSVLERFSVDSAVELAETCQIAIERIKWMEKHASGASEQTGKFGSVDPAPAYDPEPALSIDQLKALLLDEKHTLFERYRAMFALRDTNTEESILALTSGFQSSSALFRHEIAFVLGQLCHPCSEPALTQVLSDPNEHGMVRHECAEALGAIATETCMQTLQKYVNDPERLVRESCEVALDMCDYANSSEFQYANGLNLVI